MTVVAAGLTLHEALAAAEHLKKGKYTFGYVGKIILKFTEVSKSLLFSTFCNDTFFFFFKSSTVFI